MKNNSNNSPQFAIDERRGLHRLWPRRLGVQLILLFSLMLAGSMLAFSYRMLDEVVANITSNMRMQAGVLAQDISATGANFLLERDYTAIEQMLLRTIDFPGVIAIQICDSSGRLIGDVSRSPGKAPEVHYGRQPLKIPAGSTASTQYSETQMVVWQPILLGDLLGWAKITYSLQDIVDAEKRFWLTNAIAGAGIILLTLLGLSVLIRRPLASVGRYTEFAGKLDEMHGEKTPVDNASIELQMLGKALNSASVRLEEQAAAVNNAMSELEELAAFPENNPNIVLSMNADTKVTYLNPDGLRTLASIEPWSEKIEVLLPQKIEVLLPHDYRAIVERCLSDGKTVRAVETEFNQRTWLWTFAPLHTKRIVHGYGLEITQRKKAEEYARNVLLEKQAAESANQAKSVFLANMSHEIRTPLNGVLGFLKLLSKTPLNGTQREYLNTTKVSARMLLTVINDILDFSKIEAGKISIEQIEIDFKELLEDIISLHAANAEAKGLDLVFVFRKAVPTRLLGDPSRITQVLSNLIGNAIKFTQHGEILVQVNLLQETDTDVLVEVSVIDSGIGISAESLERLFQPFSQADASTTRKHGGTGLGLVITKALVELMGGNVSVKSRDGEGSRFAFTLRLSKQEATAASATASENEAMAALHILTVTPNPMVALSISANLHAWNNTANSVSSGGAAVEAMEHVADKQHGYDAVFFDDSVGDMTSKEFSARLKAIPHHSNTPIILLGSISKSLHADGMDLDGFAACISKPAKSSDIYKALSKIFMYSKKTIPAPEPQAFQLQSREGGRKLRVLIVDDNEINRKLAKILVEQLGGEPETAVDGAQAVAACTRRTYDLVLMDANMPIMDGIEATIRIRESEKHSKRHTPVIALTANAMSGDRERYLAAGMDEYLSKPINEMAFTRVLHKLGLTVAASHRETAHLSETPPDAENQAPLPILDPQMGVELSFGDRETWRTIIGMLFGDLSGYVSRLIEATSAGDMEKLCQTAHKLAGASSYCGTPALNQQARQVERLARKGDADSTARAVDALLRQIERLLALKINGNLPDGEYPVF
jgi:signal transduction histidine kinase/DNA-binding response OmpR family regulator/HPt (histidine-containing phosphotransfer) domain-containing protein